MGGKRFYIPFHPEHAKELGNDRAELYYEYLKFCQREEEGVTKSVAQIERELGMKRAVQENARKLLSEKGWISYTQITKKSPTLRFIIKLSGQEKYEKARAKLLSGKLKRIGRR
jgi:hypothetical protein